MKQPAYRLAVQLWMDDGDDWLCFSWPSKVWCPCRATTVGRCDKVHSTEQAHSGSRLVSRNFPFISLDSAEYFLIQNKPTKSITYNKAILHNEVDQHASPQISKITSAFPTRHYSDCVVTVLSFSTSTTCGWSAKDAACTSGIVTL